MVSASSPSRDVPSGDELDAILNGIDDEDLFDTSNIQPQIPTQATRKTGDVDIGIDEEVKVAKARKPVPKLDEDRLLSAAGIPRLRRISKERLRFKGKGHEYGDIARMLNMYQLWLDDLYPRAKFADGLAMIEALGHKKRIHLMRREWMDEGKPKGSPDTDPEENGEKDTAPAAATESDTAQMEGIQAGGIDVESEHRTPTQDEPPPKPSESAQAPIDDGNPDEDDLDALLAESADLDMPSVPPPQTVPAQGDDPFADDLEAMAEMEGMW